MAAIETYVFVDLETTGLPEYENNMTRITEMCLLAVKRRHVVDASQETPRVQHKLKLCFNPGWQISERASELSGLTNNLLENEPAFKMATFTLINTFLERLTKPICLIAHNGHNFDFPILKNHLLRLGVSLSEDLRYADSMYGFYDIDMKDVKTESSEGSVSRFSQPFFNKGKPSVSYALGNVYERSFNSPAENTHTAEGDCFVLLKCFVRHAQQMIQWVDENNSLFSDIVAMPVVD